MFTGFSDKTFDFLYGIRYNNERLWFQAHKKDYETYLYRPMVELAKEVFAGFTARWPDWEGTVRVARIYKDARRYYGISPYKNSIWFSLRGPVEEWQDAPTFWFEIQREWWTYGLGYYQPKASTMARHRALIDAHPARLLELLHGLYAQREFHLDGASYARFKPCKTVSLAGWYNMKSFSILHEDEDTREVCKPSIVERLVDGFSFLMPYYEYFLPLSQERQA